MTEAAVVDWLDTAYPDEVEEIIGVVPPRLMSRIRQRLEGLEEERS